MYVFLQIRQFVHFEFNVLIVRTSLRTREGSCARVVNLSRVDVVGWDVLNRFSHMDIYGIC